MEYYYEGNDKTFESRCCDIEKTYPMDVWVLEQIADLTAGRTGEAFKCLRESFGAG